MSDWYSAGLESDLRRRMFKLASEGRSFTLATIARADGGPRPVGSQMVIVEEACWGFLSGGCIEADVALHGREVLADGAPRRLVYGRGSPFIDMRLPCGGRLELLLERIDPEDKAVAALERLTDERRRARWTSDGEKRRCDIDDLAAVEPHGVDVTYEPLQRLIVIGWDPFALAITGQGIILSWETTLVRPHGPGEPPLAASYSALPVWRALDQIRPDRWTAIAIATHDLDLDHDGLVAALGSDAGYVGVLGARRRLPERLDRLRRAGVSEAALERLRAPIGLPLGGTAPHEVAISVVAEIMSEARRPAAPGLRRAS